MEKTLSERCLGQGFFQYQEPDGSGKPRLRKNKQKDSETRTRLVDGSHFYSHISFLFVVLFFLRK